MSFELRDRIGWIIETIKADNTLDEGVSDAELAKRLSIDKNTIAAYRNKKGMIKGEFIENLIKEYGFSPAWIFTGEGEPFPGARNKYPDACGPLPETTVSHTPPPADALPERGAVVGEDPAQYPAFDPMAAVSLAAQVLGSKSSYAHALYLNIVHFNRAIKVEQRNADLESDMKKISAELNKLKTEVIELRRQLNLIREARERSEDLAPTAGADSA